MRVIPPFIILLIGTFLSCESPDISQSDTIVFPDSNVSFQWHVLPILKANCGLSYCHGEIAPRGNILIYDYFTLMTSYGGSLVIPKNANGSVLMQIIEYKLPHNPFLQWKINDNQRVGIRKWIEEGAKNN